MVNKLEFAGLFTAQESLEKILHRKELLPVLGFREMGLLFPTGLIPENQELVGFKALEILAVSNTESPSQTEVIPEVIETNGLGALFTVAITGNLTLSHLADTSQS